MPQTTIARLLAVQRACKLLISDTGGLGNDAATIVSKRNRVSPQLPSSHSTNLSRQPLAGYALNWKGFTTGTARLNGQAACLARQHQGQVTCVARSYKYQLKGFACPPGDAEVFALETIFGSARRSFSRNSEIVPNSVCSRLRLHRHFPKARPASSPCSLNFSYRVSVNDNYRCSKGPPVKLIHGLARTKTAPTSAPTAARLTLFHASGCAAPVATHFCLSSAAYCSDRRPSS